MTVVRVKVCCISTVEEARMAVEAGAAALGLVSHMPSGPGVISEDAIARIAACVPPGVSTFLLTSRVEAASVIDQQRRTGCSTLQLVDAMEANAYGALREALPGIRIVQVVHVRDETSVAEAAGLVGAVDALLLDSGNPSAPVKELGGTGRVHDWTLSRRIREGFGGPVFLAGGLSAQNVARAIAVVEPYGVDICSGVRTDGRLDPVKLDRFFAAVREAR